MFYKYIFNEKLGNRIRWVPGGRKTMNWRVNQAKRVR